VRLSRMIYFPPAWLFFWIGYLHEYIIHFFQAHQVLCSNVLIMLAIATFLFLIWKYWVREIFFKKTFHKRQLSVKLKNDLLDYNNEINPQLLARVGLWASQDQLIQDKGEDLFDIGQAVDQITLYIDSNIQDNNCGLLGIVDAYGLAKSSIIDLAMNDITGENKDKTVVLKINCAGTEGAQNIERFIVHRIFYEAKRRIDVNGFVDLPNHWLEFIKSFTDSKLPDYFQSKLEQTPLDDMIRELGQLVASG